jgi:voltage-gated potassium channel
MAGVMMAAIDPGILTVGDGIWWALVSVTTVGYGDIVPTSGVGRVFGGALILIGLGLFSLLTASLTAIFVNREEPPDKHNRALMNKMLALEQQIAQLDEKIDQITQQKHN